MAAQPELLSVRVGARDWLLEAVRDQDALLAEVDDDAGLAAFPYGLLLWPAAFALAEWIERKSTAMAGKRVLELGCGIGLAGLVAASHGADVVQTDWQPAVLDLAGRAARRNGIGAITRRVGDWRAWPDDLTGFDVVVGSDILYERTVHDALTELLPRLVLPEGEIWITDPQRPQAFELLERWERSGRFRIDLTSLDTQTDEGPREILGIRLRRA